MGSPTRVLVVTENLSDSAGVLDAMASNCEMYVCVLPTQAQPAGVSAPGTTRVLTDLEAHLATDGVEFDVVVATHALPDSLVVRLRRAFPDARFLADADVDTLTTPVLSARGASEPAARRRRDDRSGPEPLREMEPARKQELEFAAQRRELELLSAYGASLQERLAQSDQELTSLRSDVTVACDQHEAEREQRAAEARQDAARLADVSRERDELRRELDAERGRVSYRAVHRVLRGLEWTRVLKSPLGRTGDAERPD
jgi:hypothetical protein